jgi:hypothetical protein
MFAFLVQENKERGLRCMAAACGGEEEARASSETASAVEQVCALHRGSPAPAPPRFAS